MLKQLRHQYQFFTILAIAGIAAALVVTNMVMFVSNRSTQVEVQGRAQFIQQTAQIEVLYREIVKALADLSVKNQDTQLRSLLAAHGISVTVNAPEQGTDGGKRSKGN